MASDWNKKITSWDWHQLVLDGCPNWDTPSYEGDHPVPASILLTIKNKVDRSSKDIAIEVDDWCEGNFYYRDFTSNGLPFISTGDSYNARFWFQLAVEAEEFYKRYGGEIE